MKIHVFDRCLILGLCLAVSVACSQQGHRVKLGKLQTGATVSFVKSVEDEWGIDISEWTRLATGTLAHGPDQRHWSPPYLITVDFH